MNIFIISSLAFAIPASRVVWGYMIRPSFFRWEGTHPGRDTVAFAILMRTIQGVNIVTQLSSSCP
ncbi:MAG: hypothetical protein HF978_02390 [Desulfobacteraceae bacterium]|nr:hypothetical protein [Desulfobacteraceae bacterium]MBC2754373.1 hypothetical protein [Desulfobacteraceae bacterium]